MAAFVTVTETPVLYTDFFFFFLLVLLQDLSQEQGLSFRKFGFPLRSHFLCIRTEDPFSGSLLGTNQARQCRPLERSRGLAESSLSAERSKAGKTA